MSYISSALNRLAFIKYMFIGNIYFRKCIAILRATLVSTNLMLKIVTLASMLAILRVNNSYAAPLNKPPVSYFTDNIIFQSIMWGGYYSLGIILLLTALSWQFKKFREVLLSILLAIFGLMLLIFAYQAFIDFNWLP